MKKLYVLDGTGILYRSYYGIRPMTTSQGDIVNALYGFIRSVQRVIKQYGPEHFIVVFDGPNNSKKRKELYPEYKANRSATPSDLLPQLIMAQEFCKEASIPMLALHDVEADDTMGAVAVWASQHDFVSYLCTSDKDLCQCINDTVFVLNIHKDDKLLDSAAVKEHYGIPPELIIDFLAMTGDTSDNIPGFPGIGPKTATALLQEYGSLDGVIANAASIKAKKRRENIQQNVDRALLSRDLVTIDTTVEIPQEESFFVLKDGDMETLQSFYEKYEFHAFIKEMGAGKKHTPDEDVEYQCVDDEEALADLILALSQKGDICFDTETTSQYPMQADLVGVGVCCEEKKAWYIPCNGKLGREYVLKVLKPFFEDEKNQFYGHNVKYDLHVLYNNGIEVRNVCFDTIIASYLLHAHSHRHSLDTLALNYFGKVKIPLKDLIGVGKKKITMAEVPIEKVTEYCCEDADYTCRLKTSLELELKERKLEKLLYDVELPLMHVLRVMERCGIYLDAPHLEKMSKTCVKKIEEVEKEIFELVGETFNINSPKQLSHILFEKMNLPASKKKTTGHSTSAEVLEGLQAYHPIAGKVLEYRSLEKLRSTYIDALPHDIVPATQRIHCSFNQYVAATGRLSCQDPNLQNIPVRTHAGRAIREAFRPKKDGWSYLSADYSQIELRLLAHLSGDERLIEAFNNGEDIHSYTASLVLGIPLDLITKEQRARAKVVNFGVLYGQQAFGLARELKISMREASQFIEMYFQRYSRVKEYFEESKNKARSKGKAVTITGRERHIPDIKSDNAVARAAAERLAVNTPIQGTAADLIKLAMIRVGRWLRKERKLGYMILQVHDELIFEVPDYELLDFEIAVREIMEHVFKLKVPLTVDISVGKNWKEC
jgi:DNA polymerase I